MWSTGIGVKITLRNILAFLTLLMVSHISYSAELFGTVDSLSGSAFVLDQHGKSTAVSIGMKIYEGQTINSGPDGEVHLVSEDGGIIALRPDSVFRVDEYKAEGSSADKIFMTLLSGAMRSITGWIGKHDTSAYRVTTPNATIGIRGTDHEITVIDKGSGDEPGTYDTVNEGATILKTPQGEADVSPGKFAFAPKGRAVAPIFLTRQPRFWAKRKLKIEGRIQPRKEFLRGRLEQMREDRIRHPRSMRGEHSRQLAQQRVNKGRVQERNPEMSQHKEFHRNRVERARQYRMELDSSRGGRRAN
jgi:hypothetical protein